MTKALPLVIGGLMVVAGLIWTLQGLGYLGGSPMSGVAAWAILGPLVAGFGVALLIVVFQRGGLR
jgi:TRAP-type C4-dicarboxylate transport system permease small subunit